jgi:hypothetical protein
MTLVLALLLTLSGAQSIPRTPAIVRATTTYVQEYQRAFTRLVADERTTQRVTRGGTVVETRQTRGELFSTFLDADRAWMSVHDIEQVDGVPVTGSNVRSLLRDEAFASVAARVKAANARYNIGLFRNLNEPTLALLLFTPAFVHDVSFERRDTTIDPGGEPLVTLGLRGHKDLPLVRSAETGRTVPLDGTATVAVRTGVVHRTVVRFRNADVDATLDTEYARDPHVDLWVPVTFDETYVSSRTGEVTTVHTNLDNYRKFETSGRVVNR